MNINKELDELLNDPIFEVSNTEATLFELTEAMKRAKEERKAADYVAQRRPCEDFAEYEPLFTQVHNDLKNGRRNLVRISKTYSFETGRFYVVSGQILYLESVKALKKGGNGSVDGRTRCIYENGTESDILLQTLRKNVVGDGYAITETEEEKEHRFFVNNDIKEEDKVTGYIYVLSSLSDNPAISNQEDLYKIGFCTTTVEQRTANAENDPTYLMAPVKIVAAYKVVNLHSQRFEDMIHQVLKAAKFRVTVTDSNGEEHRPQEWFVVPLHIIDSIIEKIMDGSIIHYLYNPQMRCLEVAHL